MLYTIVVPYLLRCKSLVTNEVKLTTWQLRRPWLPWYPNVRFANLIPKDMQFRNENQGSIQPRKHTIVPYKYCFKCATWKGKPCRFTYSFSYHLNRIIFLSSFVLGNLHHRRGSPKTKKQQRNEHSNSRSVALRDHQCWQSLQSSIPHATNTLSKQITESPTQTTENHKTAYKPSKLSICNVVEIFDVPFSRMAKESICHDSIVLWTAGADCSRK